MTRTVLKGINGSNPLGFLASVGLLRVLNARVKRVQQGASVEDQIISPRLGFTEDGAFHAWIECDPALDDIPGIVAKDAEDAAGPQSWRLEYEKQEKRGIKVVADLKAPPERFSKYLNSAIDEWLAGRNSPCTPRLTGPRSHAMAKETPSLQPSTSPPRTSSFLERSKRAVERSAGNGSKNRLMIAMTRRSLG